MTPRRDLRLLLITGLIASNVLVFLLSGYSLLQSRRQFEQRAEVQTQNVANAVDQNVSNDIEKIDLVLCAVADELERQLVSGAIDARATDIFLARLQRRLPAIEAIRVANADGLVILGNGVSAQSPVSWADREYFIHHRNHVDRNIQVAEPRLGRVANKYIIGFSQRYNYPDGRFAGVISAPVAVEHYTKLLSGFDVGASGTISLRFANLSLIARFPAILDKPSGQIGNKLVSSEYRQIDQSGVMQASFYTAASGDGFQRIVTFRRLAKAPMIVIAGVAKDDYLAAWYSEVAKTAALAISFLLLSLGLGAMLWRMLIEAGKRQQALAEHRRQLEELVEQRTSELMATEAHASHILQSTADGLYGVDSQGVITFINPAACSMLGYRSEDVIGRAAHPLFHHSKVDGSPYPVEECSSHRALHEGQTVRVDNEVYWHADGHPVPVMYATHPNLQHGKITGAVTSFVDVSEQRAAAEAREEALRAAEHLARTRREFLANMSHEIRTPLNGVLGFAEIGLRHAGNPERARDAFSKIHASGNRLLGVVNDILDFSKIEAGKMSIEYIDVVLAEVVKHANDLIAERAQAKGVALQVDLAPDLPACCLGDPMRLGQVLLNLLSNAVKFTEAGQVTLRVSRDHDQLVFQLSDTGIGMSPAQIDELFSPFQQADASATRRFGGTGLGLVISKRLLELMEGKIEVESMLGVGSVFTFRLPYHPSHNAAPEISRLASASIQQPLAGLSILVAEDVEINRHVLETLLSEDGAKVVAVSNGREAVERIVQDGRAAFDVVLMDIQMPEMDGLEATRRILELAPDLPIIAQTAHAFSDERDKCLAAGMVAHIAKPIDPDALVSLLRQQVSRRPASPRQTP